MRNSHDHRLRRTLLLRRGTNRVLYLAQQCEDVRGMAEVAPYPCHPTVYGLLGVFGAPARGVPNGSSRKFLTFSVPFPNTSLYA
jgi:hypothetical protein